jgi:hypothetical protein
MKKIIYIKCAMLLAAFIMAAVTFVACEKEENSAVQLDAFGPTPLRRGELVHFMGSNLDKVTAVVFPQSIEVAPTVVSSSEITAVIPAEAEDGHITLRYPGGSLSTKSRITYADAIAYTAITGKTEPVRAGDTITISGDNLTSVTQVVFSVDVAVESKDFLTQERYQITLTVPNNAQTGDVYLLAGATESEHKHLAIAGLAITSFSPESPKPGRDTLVVTGTNLDLAVSVIYTGNITVEAVPVSATQIKAAVPANALNGTITVVSAAGVKYASPGDLTLLAPTHITHAADRYKAGNTITLSGNDLDLVTGITFPGDVNAEFAYGAGSTTLVTTIPETATDGAIILRSIANSVTSPDVTLVKPAITATTPTSIVPGDEITIAGADLDLVTEVQIAGKVCVMTDSTETEIKATTPVDASIGGTGKTVTLILANGTQVTTTIDVTVPAYCFVLEFPEEIKAGEMLKVTVVNGDKLNGVEINGTATPYVLQGATLFVLIPERANGQVTLELLTPSNGSATYTIDVIGTGPVTTIIWSGAKDVGNWADYVQLAADLFSAAKIGDVIKVTVDPGSIQGDSQGSLKNGSWSEIAPGTEYFTITGDFTLEITQDILTALQSGGLVIGGKNYVATQVSVVSGGSGGEVLWEGSMATESWSGFVSVAADKFAGAGVGDRIVVTCTDVADNAQWGIRDGSWSNIVDYADITGTSYEYTIDAAGLTALQASGGIFTGHDYTIIKIELMK